MVKDAAALITGETSGRFIVDTPEFREDTEKYKKHRSGWYKQKNTPNASRRAVTHLFEAGFCLRDIGTFMGISHQRVAQLCA